MKLLTTAGTRPAYAFCLVMQSVLQERFRTSNQGRIIIAWPTSAESLYDAFSKTDKSSHVHIFAALVCTYLQSNAYMFRAHITSILVIIFEKLSPYVSCTYL